jgi:predicted small lipoprotein YifL
MRIGCWMLVVALADVLGACGQKGPLVLPDTQPRKKIGIPKPPASATPQNPAPGGLPASKPAPTDPTATGEAKTAPAPPQ